MERPRGCLWFWLVSWHSWTKRLGKWSMREEDGVSWIRVHPMIFG